MQPFSAELPGTPPITSAEFWERPERVEASSDPDTATAQTIKIMCQHVKQGASDAGRHLFPDGLPMVRNTAQDALSRFGGLAGDTRDGAVALACAAWWWHKLFVKFVLHDFIIANRLGEYGHLQGLISPEVLVRMEKPEGDCAIFVMGIAAMLRAFGVPYEFVTVKVSRRNPKEYGHVYLYAVMSDGRRIPLDASHGDEPGWQVPQRDIQYAANQTGSPAVQVWDADGNPVADQGSRFDGLHGYGLRGLGDTICYEDGTCEDVSTGTNTAPDYTADPLGGIVVPEGGSVSFGTFTTAAGTPYSGSAYSAPSQSSSAAWANFAAAMGKAGMTLAQINAIQPGTVVGANGQILRQSTGYAVPGTTLTSALGSNSTLILGLAAVAGLMLFMGKR